MTDTGVESTVNSDPDENPELVIATLRDVDAIAPLMDGYRQFYGQSSDVEGARKFVQERLALNQSAIILARQHGEVAGFTQLYPSFSSVSMGTIWVLNDLFVRPDSRRAGLGRALLEAAVQFCQQQGSLRLTLATAPDNSAAQSLYESMGWKQDGFLHYEFEA